MPGTNACQTSASLSASGIRVSAPAASNRHNVTLSATVEASAKFVPAIPRRSPGVAPSGNGVPGRAPVLGACGAARPAGTVPAAVVAVWLLVIAGPFLLGRAGRLRVPG